MKSALVAIDPLIKESKKFEHFCEILKAFQSEGPPI